jgi:hypothetical protein
MRIACGLLLLVSGMTAAADEPCKSGLRESQRPGPYTALISVGPQRGQQHCFICESGERPLVIVFARRLTAPLGKLVAKLDKALAEHKAAELRAWVTFLTDDQVSLDPRVVRWSKQHATGTVPLGVFEDPVGPPTYLLASEADVTVLLSVRQKVVANFAFRAGELNDAAVGEIMKAVPRIVNEGK